MLVIYFFQPDKFNAYYPLIIMVEDAGQFIKKIGENIKTLRLEQKMTQLDLAVKSEMEENALQRIERGRTNPTVKTLVKITNALKIDFTSIFEKRTFTK